MKSLFLIFTFLVLSSFQHGINEPSYHVGTMNFYKTPDGHFFINYRGDYPVCFMREMVISLFSCDTFDLIEFIDDSFPIPIDSIEIDTIQIDTIPIQKI